MTRISQNIAQKLDIAPMLLDRRETTAFRQRGGSGRPDHAGLPGMDPRAGHHKPNPTKREEG